VTAAGVPQAAAIAARHHIRLHNRVVPVLVAIGFATVLVGGFVSLAPNRLVSGRPIGLFAASPGHVIAIAILGVILLASSFVSPSAMRDRLTAALSGLLLVTVLLAAGEAARALTSAAPPLARIALGPAFWVLLGASALSIVDALQRGDAGLFERLVVTLILALAVAGLAASGEFAALSLSREFHARQAVFMAALWRHVVLVCAAVGPAVLLGLPLGIAAVRRPRLQDPLFAALNLLQTIPSIALFGLLLVPLSALGEAIPSLSRLGIGGVGVAPAIIALILYALLPIVRNTVAGITSVDGGVVDAARGMGMNSRQLLWRIELPLAAPLLLAGLRIVTVQAIGLAVIAALIGAGGLGDFVFQGLGQAAADLVLLGALPAILLALVADFLLQSLAVLFARR
jgi:osmoprotectant transport system permease protein